MGQIARSDQRCRGGFGNSDASDNHSGIGMDTNGISGGSAASYKVAASRSRENDKGASGAGAGFQCTERPAHIAAIAGSRRTLGIGC